MKTLLFDIDGTLMLTGRAGLHAIQNTLMELYGITKPTGVSVHGQTDRGIAADLFRENELPDTIENWDTFRETYARHLKEQLPKREGTLLPGVLQLLTELQQLNEFAIGLLTGNIEQGAKLKLAHYEIDHFFDFGGFGDHHPDRNDVAAAAKANAESTLGKSLNPDSIWVIGDTPNDIRCAHSIGANVLAVATGATPQEELASHQPTHVAPDLSNLDAMIDLFRS